MSPHGHMDRCYIGLGASRVEISKPKPGESAMLAAPLAQNSTARDGDGAGNWPPESGGQNIASTRTSARAVIHMPNVQVSRSSARVGVAESASRLVEARAREERCGEGEGSRNNSLELGHVTR